MDRIYYLKTINKCKVTVILLIGASSIDISRAGEIRKNTLEADLVDCIFSRLYFSKAI